MRVHRLKETYQPNMLIGQIVTIVFCAALALYIKITDSADNQKVAFFVNQLTGRLDARDLEAHGTTVDDPPAGLQVSSPLGIGVQLEPVRRNVLPTRACDQYSSHPDNLPLPEPGNLSSSPFGSVSGPLGSGFSDSDSSSEAHTQRVMAALIRVLYQQEPEYPPSALRAKVEGEVEVLVYVDNTGRTAVFPRTDDNGLTHWVTSHVISVTPRDWFFEEAAVKVLSRWRFMPRIESGRPVGSYLKIRFWFCISSDCREYEIEQAPISPSH